MKTSFLQNKGRGIRNVSARRHVLEGSFVRPSKVDKESLRGSILMTIHVQGGINAFSSGMPLLPISISNCVGQGQTIHKIKLASPSSERLAQRGNEACSRVPGRGQGSLKQRSKQIVFSSRPAQPRKETFPRVFEICYGERQGSFKQRKGANEGMPVLYGQGHEVIKEQQVTEHEEVLSPSTGSRLKRIFIFGFGYTTCALATYLKTNNWKVSGTCRSDGRRASLKQCGYSTFLFNSDTGETLGDDGLLDLQQASHWLTSVPPVVPIDGDPVLATHIRDLKIAVENGSVSWIGYLSSTGVYGDWHGNWVDEESKPRPVEQRAMARLAAEESWLKFGLDVGVPVHVFRLGGIYGPGRSALDTVLQMDGLSSRQKNREQQRFTSRIHVADICQTVLSSMQNPCPGRIYNIVDDDPAPRMEVLAYARDLLNKKSVNLPSHTTNSALGEKRVSNARIKVELKVELLYPTYRSGLNAIFEADHHINTA